MSGDTGFLSARFPAIQLRCEYHLVDVFNVCSFCENLPFHTKNKAYNR